MTSRHVCSSFLFGLLLLVGLGPPADAQVFAPSPRVLVHTGATAQVSNGGTWHLQGAQMDFGTAESTARLKETSKGRVTGGTLLATRHLEHPSSANPAGLGAEVSASVDLGAVVVGRAHVVQTAENGNESIRRVYVLDPAMNNSGLDATLAFSYHEAELNGLSESKLEFFKSTDEGSTWSEEGIQSRDLQTNTVTLSGIDSFAGWTLGSTSSPLPVELASFEGTAVSADGGEAIRLTWRVGAETRNAGFQIQRRRPGGMWQDVGYRKSKAPGGTTSQMHTYRFTDVDLPYGADSLSYRLRQVDTEGTATLTESITLARGEIEAPQLKGTYPNPASGQVLVRYAIPAGDGSAEGALRLYDVLGRKVRTIVAGTMAGRHETTVDVSGLSSGIYLLRLQAAGETQTRRLTVVR